MIRIGLSSCFLHADPLRPIFKGKTLVYAELSICHWVMSQGAVAYLIPPPGPDSAVGLAELAHGLHGLLLQGGSDIAPENYGESPLRPEWKGDAVRDAYEQALLREFLHQGKPVLGICRGAQLINVAFGGSLYQDIATQLPVAGNHRDWEAYDRNFHELRILPGTRTSRIYGGATKGRVNTVHHQAIRRLGDGLAAEAFCAGAGKDGDAVIEAVSLRDPRHYVYGVQWHPEFQDPADATLLPAAPILSDFLDETRARANR